jgi:hypothetical protein
MIIVRRLLTFILLTIFLHPVAYSSSPGPVPVKANKSAAYNREYTLQATMLGYFGTDGKRNPVLQANKGDMVRIQIVNGENMTHDIALEKMGLKSKTLAQKGDTTSIVFKAEESDTYFCSIPGHRAAGMVGKFEVVEGAINTEVVITGFIPKKNNKALNLGFESGNTSDWTATGDAFADALVSQDPSPVHEKDMRINMSGKYFVSSGGTKNYKKTGTLTSVPFTVTHPFAAFKVSGGALQDTRVELIRTDNNQVFFQITGSGRALTTGSSRFIRAAKQGDPDSLGG